MNCFREPYSLHAVIVETQERRCSPVAGIYYRCLNKASFKFDSFRQYVCCKDIFILVLMIVNCAKSKETSTLQAIIFVITEIKNEFF